MIDRYSWRGGSEMLLRHGCGHRPTLLVLPALFEEGNRTRRFTVELMRKLADRGLGSQLPDLPGTGESLARLEDMTLDDWKHAAQVVATAIRDEEGHCLTIALRGGALLDSCGDFGWRLSPESGERVARDLVRATALARSEPASAVDRAARAGTGPLAGHHLAGALYRDLLLATPVGEEKRTLRLEGEAGVGDGRLKGIRLWRSAEPGEDTALATAAADDVHLWSKTCVEL